MPIAISIISHAWPCLSRLQSTCARGEEIAQRLTLEKRLLYRTNMDMDEIKLKRIEIQAERTEVQRTCAKQLSALEKRKQAAEAELAKLQAELAERRATCKDRVAHLQWKKDQNVMQRDRLRKQLTQM